MGMNSIVWPPGPSPWLTQNDELKVDDWLCVVTPDGNNLLVRVAVINERWALVRMPSGGLLSGISLNWGGPGGPNPFELIGSAQSYRIRRVSVEIKVSYLESE